MADQANQKTTPRYPPPPYTQFDAKDREQFLSEIGNITPGQREIFHILCKTWQPEIPHARILAQITGQVKNASAELEHLVEKLSDRKCGLMTVRYSDGEAVRDKIILTAPGDCRYFYFRLRNELETYYQTGGAAMPLEEALAAKGFFPPPSCVENLTEKDYSRVFDDAGTEETSLYRIPLPDGEALILPPGGGQRFIGHCLARMRAALTDPNLAAELARLRETSIADLKKRADLKDPYFWLETTKSIRLLRADPLAAKRFPGSPEFFKIAEILAALIECHVAELKRKTLAEDERRRDMEALAMQMETEKEKFIPPDRFDLLLGSLKEKYGDDFDSLRKNFLASYVEFSEAFKMPQVVRVADGYLQRKNFYEYFLARLFSLREAMGNDLVKTMEHLLRTNNRERKTLFFSRDNFETEIIERLRGMDAFLSEVFEKPRLLTEAVIYTMKEKRKVKDLTLVTDELEKYFKPDTMTYRSLTSILGLSIIDIFLRAFSRLPFWRQIWMRITGKFEGYQNQYMGQSLRPSVVPAAAATRGAAKRTKSETVSSGRESAGSRKEKTGFPPRKKFPPPPPAKKKPYSKKQQESAWEEFSKSIRSK